MRKSLFVSFDVPRVFSNIGEFRSFRLTLGNRLVGFVPTMGYLHEGHISLMKRAKEDCGFVVASVFVNPIQFSPNEDLSRYPRNLERDLKLMKRDSVADVVFIPTHAEMYPSHYRSFVSLENIDQLTREGTSRPDHFRGVATVLAKLFNIIQPHKAYFGQKDGIQAIVVKSMVRDLNFPIEIVIVDTMRERDGLAMSSRNVYLSKSERRIAPILFRALSSAKEAFERDGVLSAQRLLEIAKEVIESEKRVSLEYLTLSDLETGYDIELPSNIDESHGAMLSGAIRNGQTRLIDNVLLRRQ